MSSKSQKAVLVRGLSKRYRIPGRNNGGRAQTFWALRGVDLEVDPGEVVGVIGRNGAGKSTFLKVLTRITPPSEGFVELCGRVGSLLEVGTGFHPELTGRENIYLNGAILGMRRAEIRASFDAIVTFAGVERFLDMPVKRYSSGMYVRLAFAVAAHLRSEILLVDEVLSVGDADFQRRCLGKMRDAASGGRTVLFVSHHLESVAALCSRAVVLESGQVSYDGEVSGGLRAYAQAFGKVSRVSARRSPGSIPNSGVAIVEVEPANPCFGCTESKRIRVQVSCGREQRVPYFVSLHVVDARGAVLLQCDSRLKGGWIRPEEGAHSRVDLEFVLRGPWLKPGCYRIDAFVCASGILDRLEGAAEFTVVPPLPYEGGIPEEATAQGAVLPDFEWSVVQRSCGASPPVDGALSGPGTLASAVNG
ncbi:MAG: hypothetical protein RLZZ244_1984 [Verrucomicrobiota bacterium]